jgi:Flp pilus assembly CpaF family ATPase
MSGPPATGLETAAPDEAPPSDAAPWPDGMPERGEAPRRPGPGRNIRAEMTVEEFRATVRQIFRDLSSELGDGATPDQARTVADQLVRAWAEQRAVGGQPLLSQWAQDRIVRAVLDEQYGLGPLQPYVSNREVENVDINGPRQVWVTLRGGRKRVGEPIAASNEELVEMVRSWGLREGQTPREFSTTRPMLNAGLSAMVRLSAVMSVTRHVHISVRCHRLVDVTLDDLAGEEYQTLSPALAHFLQALVRAHRNIMVTGGVDAGKTTLLRALSAAIDPSERIATLESERELYLDLLPERHHDVVAFEARQPNSEGAGEITLHDLIPQALRLNPRRIVVGEVRDQEIRPMLEAMNSGQEGSLTTIHANSADEIFNRILMLAQRGQMAMTAEAIHLSVGLSRPFVIHIRKDKSGDRRYVSEVIEVFPPADGAQPARNRVFSPGPDGRAAPDHSLSSEALTELMAAGFNPGVLAGGQP